jgi:hypothetical protein
VKIEAILSVKLSEVRLIAARRIEDEKETK